MASLAYRYVVTLCCRCRLMKQLLKAAAEAVWWPFEADCPDAAFCAVARRAEQAAGCVGGVAGLVNGVAAQREQAVVRADLVEVEVEAVAQCLDQDSDSDYSGHNVVAARLTPGRNRAAVVVRVSQGLLVLG